MAAAGARYTRVTSEKWEDPWYLSLPVKVRHLFDFLCEGSHGTYAGVFRLDMATAKLKTGPWGKQQFEEAKALLEGHVMFFPQNWVFVVNYLQHNGYSAESGLSETQAKGVISIVLGSPIACRAAFWARYGADLARLGFTRDTLGIPPDYPNDTTIPNQTIPNQTKSRDLATCSACRQPKEEQEWKQARMDAWAACLKRYYQVPAGETVSFPDAGHAAHWFMQLARQRRRDGTPKWLNDGDQVDKAIWLFFKRRADWRDEQWAKARAIGKVPPAVPVRVALFRQQFEEYMDLVRRHYAEQVPSESRRSRRRSGELSAGYGVDKAASAGG